LPRAEDDLTRGTKTWFGAATIVTSGHWNAARRGTAVEGGQPHLLAAIAFHDGCHNSIVA
jgi:hypothetical protein